VVDSNETANPLQTGWYRSSLCDSDTCVEVSVNHTAVLIRNSRDHTTELTFSPAEWRSFLMSAKNHEFDLTGQPRTGESR
jgi:hypothetical protein